MAFHSRKPAKTAQSARKTTTKQAKRKVTPARDKKQFATPISLRTRTEADDAFLLQATRETMKEVFEKSVGAELTDAVILSNIKTSGTTLIIEQDGKPIGYTCYSMARHNRMYWGALVLLPSAQDQGIGSRICQNMFEHARQLGCEAIDGHVQVHNEVAVKFWKNQGFVIVGGPTAGSYEIEKKLR